MQISVENISFYYADDENNRLSSDIFNNLSLQVEKGEFIAVLGHNGCGKSTLAKHINGILTPVEGTVYIEGISTEQEENLFEIRQNVGMIFQNPDNQIVATIVEEDVAFGPENLGVEPKEIRQRVDDALKTVDMYDYRMHAPSQLSGGQKQRVAIAGIIAMRPSCIVMDEATAMLDPKGRKEVMETAKMLNQEYGITIILITHYMEEAAQAKRVIVMDEGKILYDDVPKKVFSHVEELKKIGLDVPQVTDLIYQLKQRGIDLNQEIITEEDCVAELMRLVGRL